MRTKLASMAAAAVATLTLGSAPVLADSVDIDLAGWQSAGGFGDAGNAEVFIDIGVDSVVTGFDYIDLAFSTEGASWLSEFTLSVNNVVADPDLTEFIDLSPSLSDEPGRFGPASGSWNATAGLGSAPFSVGNGPLWVTVYENFDDDGIDAVVSQGTLRVHYDVAAPIPEPGTYALMALGLAAVGAAARRRKA